MAQTTGSAVPKFGSFKARTSGRRSEDGPQVAKSTTAHKRHRNESRKKDSAMESPDSRLSSTSQYTRVGSKVERVESDSFIIDVRGDSKNVEYGCLHRYDIPSYRRIGDGSIIGAPSGIKIDRDYSTEKTVVLRTHHSAFTTPRASKSSPKGDDETRQPLLDPVSSDRQGELEQDFLSLKRKRDSEKRSGGAGIWSFIRDTSSSDDEEQLRQT